MLLAERPPRRDRHRATASCAASSSPATPGCETGDLFRRDADGDFWLVDHVSTVIRTAAGVVFSGPIQDALGDVDAVALAVAYGVPTRSDSGAEIPCAAVTLREGRELDVHEVERALADLGDTGIPLGDPGRRPDPADHLVPADHRSAQGGGPAGAHDAGRPPGTGTRARAATGR